MSQETYATATSVLDKTDYRKTIHKCLEACIFAEGKIGYPNTVKSLYSCVSATYPGFNAKKIIEEFIVQLKVKYRLKTEEIILKNPDYWFHPGKRAMIEPDLRNAYYKELFEFIKNLLAKKRILLYGSRKVRGGSQMADE